MLKIQEKKIKDYETVIEGIDTERGLHCFIAIHSTALGPALGGVRIYPYPSEQEGLDASLRLAKAMTYKSALAKIGLGGGKSVILANPNEEKTPTLLEAFGEVVDHLGGRYIAAEDVGSTTQDLAIMRRKTPYIGALETEESSGDPSRFTAWGVFRGMQAVAKKLWGSPSLTDKTIAIQGLGSVGSKLANLLFWAGADLTLCDIDPMKLKSHCHDFGAKQIPVEAFDSFPCDILSPCAMGRGVNIESVANMQCKAVAGSANSQMEDTESGRLLIERGILYAPDYIINAGGIINAASEFDERGYDPKKARDKTDEIFDTLLLVFERSAKEGKPTNVVANELAEFNLQNKLGKRESPIAFTSYIS